MLDAKIWGSAQAFQRAGNLTLPADHTEMSNLDIPLTGLQPGQGTIPLWLQAGLRSNSEADTYSCSCRPRYQTWCKIINRSRTLALGKQRLSIKMNSCVHSFISIFVTIYGFQDSKVKNDDGAALKELLWGRTKNSGTQILVQTREF